MAAAAAAAKSLQSCPTLCDPIDGSPPGSPVPGILQARALEWGAISFSNAWKWKVKVKSLSHVRLFVTPWTAAYQDPPSMGFSRQEYWSALPFHFPGDLPDPGIEPRSPAWYTDDFTVWATREVTIISIYAPNNRRPKYRKQNWLKWREELNITVGDFNNPLSIMEEVDIRLIRTTDMWKDALCHKSLGKCKSKP